MDNGGKAERAAGAVQRGLRETEARMREGLGELSGYAESMDLWIRRFARDRPLLAIACAAGLGFLVGRLVSRT
jgi:ElaB/YqjD/DUF883 family membrane-anchored ribosome-binding protein